MSFEAITAINEAEANARQMRADAAAAAKAADAAAVEEGKLAMEAARKKAAAEVKELLLDFNFIDIDSISCGRYMTYTDMQGNHLMDLATREDLLTVGLSGGAEYIAPGYAMSMELAEHSSGISTVFTVYKLEDGSLSEMFTLNDIIGLGILGII